jgi:hypothetical protein
MRLITLFAGVVPLLVSAVTLAQPPYVISGLHTDLTLDEAQARAEQLGGVCRAVASRPNAATKNVQCDYPQTTPDITALTFASHPILSVSLVAPADSSTLTQIVLVYKGDTEAVAADLIESFGETESEGAPTDKTSWTHARRWSWRQGDYRMGLMDSPQLIILSSDRMAAPPATGSRAGGD